MRPKSRSTETGVVWSHMQAERTNGSQYMCFRLNPVGRQTCRSSSSQSQAAFQPHGSDHVDSAGEDTSLSTGSRTVSRGPVWLAHGYPTHPLGMFFFGGGGGFFFFPLKSWNLNQPETPHNCTSQYPRKASPGEQNSGPHPSPSASGLN